MEIEKRRTLTTAIEKTLQQYLIDRKKVSLRLFETANACNLLVGKLRHSNG